MSFDLKDVVFKIENTIKGYEHRKPRLIGGEFKIVPKDGLRIDDALKITVQNAQLLPVGT